jgi:hypothetical protein
MYFRSLLIGYFEGIDSERGIAWRLADSLALRQFLQIGLDERTPDHSTISRTRRLIDLETHRTVFGWVLGLLADRGLLKGKIVGIDATTLEANAAMRSIVRRDNGQGYEAFLTELAKKSGIATPTREDLAGIDRKRKKKGSNQEWESATDPDARITKMKDGSTHMAHKAEHAVDMETGAVMAVTLQAADQGARSMSIILNGASYRSVWWWTRHFNDTKENVRTEIVKSEGLASEDIRDKMLEMQLMAEGTRCKNFMWIADLSPHPGVSRRFSEEEWERARQIAEKFRGLEGQPYFVIEQEKADGRIHRHAIWSRVDTETGRARPDGWDSEVCHAASKAIRQELGLQPLPSPFDKDRQGPRPKRAPQRWEMYRGMKSGLDPRVITAEVTELFHQSDNGRAFHAALELHGYTLVKGDQRGFVILDSAGDDHSLARRIDGVNTKELNAFMRGVDREALPTVEQGRAQHQERTIAALEADRATVRDEIRWEEALDRAAIEKEERERNFVEPVGQQEKKRGVGVQKEAQAKTEAPELGRTAGEIRLAYSLTQTGQEFANALEDRGYILARITDEDAERLNRWDRQRRKEEWETPVPVPEKEKEEKPEYDRFKAGDLAVVTPYAQVYPLTKANTGDGRKDREEHLKDINRATLLSVTDAENVMRGVQRHRKEEREQERAQRREEILRAAAEKHWPAKPPQPEQKSPGLFAQAADQASLDERVANLKDPQRRSGNYGPASTPINMLRRSAKEFRSPSPRIRRRSPRPSTRRASDSLWPRKTKPTAAKNRPHSRKLRATTRPASSKARSSSSRRHGRNSGGMVKLSCRRGCRRSTNPLPRNLPRLWAIASI